MDDVHLNTGLIVLDPFMGGGTTVVEALRLGCKVVGCDLNPVAWWTVKQAVEAVPIGELHEAFRQPEAEMVRFIRETLQDAANLLANRRQTVQFVVRGKIDRGQFFEVRQPTGQYVNLSAVFGARLRQEANDWLVAPLWV